MAGLAGALRRLGVDATVVIPRYRHLAGVGSRRAWPVRPGRSRGSSTAV